MSKASLVKRLRWYYPLEKFHACFTFPLIAIYLLLRNPITDIVFLMYGLVLIIFILFQGQYYWKLKLQRLTGQPFDQKKSLALFKRAKSINGYLIAFIPLVFLFQIYLSKNKVSLNELTIWATVANLFGVLEHINYYYIQLSIDNSEDLKYLKRYKKLKIASLAKDLRENEI